MRQALTGLVVFVTTVALSAMCRPLLARTVEHWSHERLWSESDVVCVGTVRSVAEVSNDELSPDFFDKLIVTLKVESVFKGKVPDDKLAFTAFRWSQQPQATSNGPRFAKLENLPATEDAGSFRGARIMLMLFLKKENDGSFRPVSGDLDSALSVAKFTTFADAPIE
jgi:uncharacterized membrane protein